MKKKLGSVLKKTNVFTNICCYISDLLYYFILVVVVLVVLLS